MTHEIGANLGGVRTLADLRSRCVCRAGDDCWHFRTARGRVPKPGSTQRVWVHGRGNMTVTRAAWLLSGCAGDDEDLSLIGRTCDSRDCINPEHLAPMTRGEIVDRAVRIGSMRSPARKRQIETIQRMRTKVPRWAWEMVSDKAKTAAEWAEHFGCSRSCINSVRSKARQAGRAAA